MQDRLARGPYDALGIAATATPAEVRTAFLELTKTFHPARFGRMSTEIQRQSNEVFLALRGAHDAIAKTMRPTGPTHTPSAGMPALPKSGPQTTQRLPTGGYPVVPQRPTTATPAQRAQTGAIPVVPAAGQPSARPSPTPPTSSAARPPTSTAASGPRPQPAAPGAPRPATGAVPVQQRPQTGAYPATRPSTGEPARSARASSAPATIKADGSGAVRPRTPSSPPVAMAADPQLQLALEQIQRGQWEQARAILTTLAQRDPAKPRYRALIAYSRGREAQLARRLDEARVELMDALQIDPELELAKTALGELFARRK